MRDNKEEKLQFLDTLLTEKEALTKQVNALDKEINRVWIGFCGDFFDEGINFEERVANIKNYIAEKKPGLSERMMINLERRKDFCDYLEAVMEERFKEEK